MQMHCVLDLVISQRRPVTDVDSVPMWVIRLLTLCHNWCEVVLEIIKLIIANNALRFSHSPVPCGRVSKIEMRLSEIEVSRFPLSRLKRLRKPVAVTKDVHGIRVIRVATMRVGHP